MVFTTELSFMRKVVKLRWSRKKVYEEVIFAVEELLLVFDAIFARAVSWIKLGHFGFMATDLDWRSVMDGMHRGLCVGMCFFWQFSEQYRTMWQPVLFWLVCLLDSGIIYSEEGWRKEAASALPLHRLFVGD